MKFKNIVPLSLLLVLASPSKAYAIENMLSQDVISQDTLKLEEQILSETGLRQRDKANKIWQEYLEGKRKMPERFQLKGAKHPYFCTAFVQQRIAEAYGEDFCKERGIIRRDKIRMGGTWNLLDNLREHKCVIWEKQEKSSETFKNTRKENPKLNYSEVITRLNGTNVREAEKLIQQGDILFSWYPGSLFKQNYVTHAYIVLGKKEDKWYVFQEWGHAIEIMELDKLYHRVPGGIDAVVRLNK